jgi:hypothetical protein
VNLTIAKPPENFLDAWVYFQSLGEVQRRGEKKRVLSLRVPSELESKDIERGVIVASKVIEAMIDDLAADPLPSGQVEKESTD